MILVNILWDRMKPKERKLKLYMLPLESNKQKFLLSLCNGIEKRAFDKSMGAIKSPGRKRFLRYSWFSILKMNCGIKGTSVNDKTIFTI